MSGLHDAHGRTCKLGLLAGTAWAVLFTGQAFAQRATDLPVRTPGVAAPVLREDAPRSRLVPPTPAPVDDALGQHGFYMEADMLVRDDPHDVWTARGGVEARYQGHVLRGDEVIYNVRTGGVTINGHAQVLNADGTAEFADHIVLDDKMRAGFAQGFSAHLPYNIKFAAAVAIRRSETVNEMRRAVYTPCEVCTAKGAAKSPSWSIRASKIVEDRDRHMVYYRNAIIEVKGIPVFYAPVFWHPDPQAGRQSGLLVPLIQQSTKRGLSYQQSYYQVLSPSDEIYVTPQINTHVNPLLSLEYKNKFYSGDIDFRGGYTYEKDFASNGAKFGSETSRSFILADGAFTLNNNWSWGFAAQRASDLLIFDKYDIPNVNETRGLIGNNLRQLQSQIYATRQDSNSYFSVAALSYQGLTETSTGLPTVLVQPTGSLPSVAPVLEWRFDPKQSILGGRLQLSATGVALNRDQLPLQPTLPYDIPSESKISRRASARADWRSSYTLNNGMRIEPFVDVRDDLYNASTPGSTNSETHTTNRAEAVAGLDLSWPFIRRVNNTTIILEPLAQIDLSPTVKSSSAIPNEDSIITVFDESNLFSANKFTGTDLYDSGQRLNVGGRATIDWGGGEVAHVLLGRTFRASTTNVYANQTGLNGRASDWVVSADAVPIGGLSLFSRALINDRYDIARGEFGVNFAYGFGRGYLRYVTDNTQFDGKTTDVDAAFEAFVTKHWGVSVVAVRDLELRAWRQRELGVVYKDDCIRVEVVYQHKDTIEGRLTASDSVFVRLKLATLGDQGYKDDDDFR